MSIFVKTQFHRFAVVPFLLTLGIFRTMFFIIIIIIDFELVHTRWEG